MVRTIEQSPWIGRVLIESRTRAEALERVPERHPEWRVNLWRDHNLALQNIDPAYLSRAENNLGHFLPSIDAMGDGETASTHSSSTIDSTFANFLSRALAPGAQLSAISAYANYHAAALANALVAVRACPSIATGAPQCPPEIGQRLFTALVDEGFALHFLEDSFAAGHVVGTGGDLGQRLGTHDHYSEHGLDARTWNGTVYAAHGDGFLAAPDAQNASAAIAASLGQLAHALRADATAFEALAHVAPAGELSMCALSSHVPRSLEPLASAPFVRDVIAREPMPPSRQFGPPRYRSEVGLFVGLSVEGCGLAVFDPSSQLAYSDARFRVGAGLGVALEGAFSRYMDGKIGFDLLLAASMHEYAVGRRAVGLGLRVRLPYVVLPGDLLYLVVPAALIRRDWGLSLAQMAIAGGVGRFQRQILLPGAWSLQFILGRELTMVWFPDSGWQIDVPFFEASGDHLFTGAFATDPTVQVGFTLNLQPNEQLFGGFLSFSERIRRYIPQDCGDDCR
jgi:hypothetical protein